jgi:hypothetical protein
MSLGALALLMFMFRNTDVTCSTVNEGTGTEVKESTVVGSETKSTRGVKTEQK